MNKPKLENINAKLGEQLFNVSTVACFGLDSSADARLLEDRFEPWIDRGSLMNQPVYKF